MTPLHAPLDGWLRDGRPQPMPQPLQDHICDCDSCQRALAEVEQVRGWFPDIDDPLQEQAAGAIRFRLQAEARALRDRVSETSTGSAAFSLRWLWARPLVAAALMVVMLGGAALVVRSALVAPAARLRREVLFAQVEPAPGAQVERLSTSPDEVYRVREGVVRFAVPRQTRGRRLRVRVGKDTVVVRGTRFRVRAREDRLVEVSVDRGVVALQLSSGEEVVLSGSQSWRRQLRPSDSILAEPSDVGQDGPLPARGSRSTGVLRSSKEAAKRAAKRAARRAARPDDSKMRVDPARASFDRAFHEAWTLVRAGRLDAAAYAFDALLNKPGPSVVARHADALFWSAYAHQRAGRPALAIERLEQLVRSYPDSWHATQAQARLARLREVGSRR